MQHKSFDILETTTDAEAGTFEATVAVFGNVDKGGDRIVPGAFKNTLAKWERSGDPIPVILSHNWDDPFAHVGVVVDAKETDRGLWVKGRLDIDDNEVARQVHRLMQRRSLKEFSFGYEVPSGGHKRAKDGALNLLEIDLAEVGPTLKGMNPATELHAVKSALETEKHNDAEDLRKQAEQVAREVEQIQVPDDIPPATDEASETTSDALERVQNELQELKTQLADMAGVLEDLKTKADETDKGTKSRSVDPLRQQADAVALEVATGGVPLPPTKSVEQPPEPEIPLDELKRRMRDEMLGVLSGGTINEQV